MKSKDTRWLQRFQNFEKAFMRLREALAMGDLNELERNGLIQRFEFTIELCWKTLRDYMEDEGFQFKPTPKGTLRQVANSGLIKNVDIQVLIDGLDIRNELSHDYSENEFKKAEVEIREKVFPAIEKVYVFFQGQTDGSQTDIFNG